MTECINTANWIWDLVFDVVKTEMLQAAISVNNSCVLMINVFDGILEIWTTKANIVPLSYENIQPTNQSINLNLDNFFNYFYGIITVCVIQYNQVTIILYKLN